MSSTHPSRRWRGAVVAAAGISLIAAQAFTVAAANAAPARGPDGPAGTGRAGANSSQVPLAVRDHSATKLSAASGNQMLRLSIGLNSRDQAGQQALIKSLQNNKSAAYHQYLTAAQWNAKYAPTAADEAKVLAWASQNHLSVTQRFANRLLVDVQGTVSQVQAALHVRINNYSKNGATFYANDREPVLPSSLSSVVSVVSGLTSLGLSSGSPKAPAPKLKNYVAGPTKQNAGSAHANGSLAALKAAQAAKKPGPSPQITNGRYDPTDLYSSYGYDVNALQNVSPCCNANHLSTGSPPESSIAIVTAGAHHTAADIQGFQARYSYLAYAWSELYIDGTPTCCDFEGTMDIEWALAMANSYGSWQDTSHIYLYSGVNAQFGTFADMYNHVLSDGYAKILSSSWGCAEYDCYNDAQMNNDHAIFDAMLAQGFTLLNASGDRGAHQSCTSTYRTEYPASDPDFLAIGGTSLWLNSDSTFNSETTWIGGTWSGACSSNNGGGGGGCSAKWSAPSWQQTSSLPNYACGTMRTLPDVSLNAYGPWQNTYQEGSWQGGAGTSISTPMMAGFMARYNNYQVQIGNKCGSGTSPCAPIGQAGSQLFSAGIYGANGRNPYYDTQDGGCTTNDAGPGYCSIAGYDRATGLGTSNWLQLAYSMNWYHNPDGSAPSTSFAGASTGVWSNGGTATWTVTDLGLGPVGLAGYTASWDVVPDNTLSHASQGVGDSFYTGPATISNTGSAFIGGAGEGCHTLYVRSWDHDGTSGLASSGPYCYDGTAPTMAKPVPTFVQGTTIGTDGTVPVNVSTSGTDALSGVNHYAFWIKTGSGGYVQAPDLPGNKSNYRVRLLPGTQYTFAVASVDNAGNYSPYQYSRTITITSLQQSASTITYGGTWRNQSDANASGGSLKYTTQANATATVTVSGHQLAWIGVRGTDRGSAKVSLDGGTAVRVSSHGALAYRYNEWFTPFSATGTHTVVITNLASAGNPRIDLDCLLVMS